MLEPGNINKAVQQHIQYTKKLHMLKLIRWYGKNVLHGNYNKLAFLQLIDVILRFEKQAIDDQMEKCAEVFPTMKFFISLANKSKKKLKAEDKKNTLMQENLEQPEVAEEVGNNSSQGEIKKTEEEEDAIDYCAIIGIIPDSGKDASAKKKERYSFGQAVDSMKSKDKKAKYIYELEHQKIRSENIALDPKLIRNIYDSAGIPW